MIYQEEGRCEQCSISKENIFKTLTNKQLASVSNTKKTALFRKGETIFQQGEKLKGAYCISKGIGKLTKKTPNGKSQIIRFASKGDVLGQNNVLSEQETTLSAVALTDIEVCFIQKEEFLVPFAENNQFSKEIIQHFYSEMKKSDEKIVDLAQKTAKQRLIDLIFMFEKVFPTDSEGYIQVYISREEIGNMIGVATESLIRMLSEMTKNGLISTKAKNIKILNKSQLEKF